jgi:hypothetical protein
MKANGLTRHRFWGEYSSHIVLSFESNDDAIRAMPILNQGLEFGRFYNSHGGYTESSGWHYIKDGQGEAARTLLIEVAEPWLTEVVERLVKFGAFKKHILSMNESIDYGKRFYIEIKVEDENQMQLL